MRILKDTAIAINKKAEMVQQSYEPLASILQNDALWKEEWETAFDLIESYIFDQTVQE